LDSAEHHDDGATFLALECSDSTLSGVDSLAPD